MCTDESQLLKKTLQSMAKGFYLIVSILKTKRDETHRRFVLDEGSWSKIQMSHQSVLDQGLLEQKPRDEPSGDLSLTRALEDKTQMSHQEICA